MDIDNIKSEALRYLGFRGSEPDARTAELLGRAVTELMKSAAPKYCYKVVPAAEAQQMLKGSDIRKHVDGCERIIFFAATLGAPADALIRKAEISDMAYAVILDSAANALIEDFCDDAEKEMLGVTGGSYTWRFSPGYGDYPIAVQSEFIKFLKADKYIGLTATDSCMLLPGKSVTAVIGIKNGEAKHEKRSCDNCSMKDTCRYRKENKSCGQT